jgi:hypothetical protein
MLSEREQGCHFRGDARTGGVDFGNCGLVERGFSFAETSGGCERRGRFWGIKGSWEDA